MSTSTISDAQIQQTAQELGEKAGFLLASAPWPDDVKAAWIRLVDDMSAEELTEFAEILEFMFADALTSDIDETFSERAAAQRTVDASARAAAQAQLDALHTRIRERISN